MSVPYNLGESLIGGSGNNDSVQEKHDAKNIDPDTPTEIDEIKKDLCLKQTNLKMDLTKIIEHLSIIMR